MTQAQALAILKTGANVFLTGEPGSGKTYLINEYVAYLRGRGIEPAVTASTGIAATHIGGMTIHSWSGIGIKTKLDKRELNKIASSQYIAKRVRRTKVLIIEEVSMLSPETLSMVEAVCREIKQSPEPFGGMQVVLAGDFFQLPPVVRAVAENSDQTDFFTRQSPGADESRRARFAYDSPAWEQADPIVCYLTEQHRQDDDGFLGLLTAIRHDSFGEEHLQQLESRKIDPFDFARVGLGTDSPSALDGAPKLFAHNVDVDRINNEVLAKLPGEPQVFTMATQGPDFLVAALKKGCLSPEMLHLKTGAAVMFTKNNPKEGFINGTLGTVLGFDETSDYPLVKTRGGQRIVVEPMDWTIEEDGKIRAGIAQLPLRLAWAITVHKSQGMSLDEAVMDLSHVFEFGQGYVALSRVRRLSGLYLLGWNQRAFQVHPEILAKDEVFRRASSEAETTFSEIPRADLRTRQDNFIAICGGRIIPESRIVRSKAPKASRPDRGYQSPRPKTSAHSYLERIREIYPNAYRPWSEIQEKKLRELFAKGLSTADLAKTFGRNIGGIKSHLAKLGLVDN